MSHSNQEKEYSSSTTNNDSDNNSIKATNNKTENETENKSVDSSINNSENKSIVNSENSSKSNSENNSIDNSENESENENFDTSKVEDTNESTNPYESDINILKHEKHYHQSIGKWLDIQIDYIFGRLSSNYSKVLFKIIIFISILFSTACILITLGLFPLVFWDYIEEGDVENIGWKIFIIILEFICCFEWGIHCYLGLKLVLNPDARDLQEVTTQNADTNMLSTILFILSGLLSVIFVILSLVGVSFFLEYSLIWICVACIWVLDFVFITFPCSILLFFHQWYVIRKRRQIKSRLNLSSLALIAKPKLKSKG